MADAWTPEQVKTFRLLANRSAPWATFDLKLVALEMAELKGLNFDLSVTGFDDFEISKLFGPSAGYETLPEPANVVSQQGNLWICDGHRVLCSDSTSPESVNRLLGQVIPILMATDPPYGVSVDPMWRERAGLGEQRQTGLVANDDPGRLDPGLQIVPW